MAKRQLYVAAEIDPLHLHALNNRFLRTPNVEVATLDPSEGRQFQQLGRRFDTVLCMNVLEYMEDPERTIDAAVGVLEPDGRWCWRRKARGCTANWTRRWGTSGGLRATN